MKINMTEMITVARNTADHIYDELITICADNNLPYPDKIADAEIERIAKNYFMPFEGHDKNEDEAMDAFSAMHDYLKYVLVASLIVKHN